MGKLKRTIAIAALIGLSGLIFFLRLHTYDEPLERDVSTYAVIAHQMLAGKALYSDLWDHKPPAIHVTYAVAELIAGYGRDSILLLTVLAATGTLVACYFAGAAAGGGALGGLVAAILWALSSGDLALEGNQPNTEIFLNAFLTAGFAIFVRAPAEGLGWRRALSAGLLFALASLYKQVVVAEVGLLALVWLGCARADSRKTAIADLAVVAAIGAAAWGLVFGYFALRGHAGAFSEAVFTYNRWYSGNVWQNLSHITGWPPVSADVIAVALPIATLALAGLLLGFTMGPRRHWMLLLSFVIATHIAVLLPGRFFPHYYQLWLPPVAVGAGWTIALLKRVLPGRMSWLCYLSAGATCAVLVLLEVPYYQLPAEAWSFKKYGTIFIEADRLAAKLNKLLPASVAIYEWGNEPGIYFTTGREPPSGLIFAYPMQAGPLAAKLSWRVLDDLKGNVPELVVSSNAAFSVTRNQPVATWIRENYRPLWKTNSFVVRVRIAGKLDLQRPIAAN